MAMLTRRDLEQIEGFLRGLYGFRRPQPLISYVLKQLPHLIGTNQVSWNHVAPALGQADVMAWPAETDHEKYQAALARHMHEHPLIRHHLATGELRAIKVSDFLSKAKFQDTPLYAEMYRHLEYEDHFALQVAPVGTRWTTLVVARDRRTFSQRDRAVLDLLRPHLVQAYRQVRVLSRLSCRVEGRRSYPATSRLTLNHEGKIAHYPARAQRWIERYFDDLPCDPGRLPEAIERWLVASRSAQQGGTLGAASAPLIVRRFGRRFTIYAAFDTQRGGVELNCEERTDPGSLERLRDLGLTSREYEVLLEVEKGKHNQQIAADLGIQPRTVEKHLEHIFDKLNVDNRMAAVACLHRTPRR